MPTSSKKIAVLLFGFSDTISQTLQTIDFFKDLFVNHGTGGQNDYWISVSDGNIDLDGSQVFDWRYFNISLQNYKDLYKQRGSKIVAVKNLFSGVDFSRFDAVVAIPNANVGDAGAAGLGLVLLNIDIYNNNTFISHELGHGLFGLNHSYDDSNRIAEPGWPSQPGEYFDPWDIMSAMNVFSFQHARFTASGPILNTPLCYSLGWINNDRIYEISALRANQMVVIRPFIRRELPGYLALKLNFTDTDNGQAEYYMVELRIKEGWDAGIQRTSVLIHRVKNGTPFLQSSDISTNTQDWESGQTFKDVRNNITIYIENLSSSFATISIGSQWNSGSITLPEKASIAGCVTGLSRAKQTLEIFWIGADGSIQDAFWYEGPGNKWQTFQMQAPKASLTGDITAVSRIPNTIEIFWIGADGSIQDAFWYERPGNKWQTFQMQAPKASLTGDITAVSRIPNTIEIFWIGADGSIQDAFWYEGSTWQTFQMQVPKASLSGGITAVSRIPNSIEIFWIGADGSIQDAFWYEGNNWQTFQMQASKASLSGGITAVSRVPNSMEIFWIGANGSIQGAYWYEGNNWQTYQLSGPGTASVSGGISAVSRMPNSLEVFWIGNNGLIQGANWYENAEWHLYTLPIEPAAKASGNGRLRVVSRIPGSMELLWIGNDGSIQDAHWYE